VEGPRCVFRHGELSVEEANATSVEGEEEEEEVLVLL
jgi:hypothetical protein